MIDRITLFLPATLMRSRSDEFEVWGFKTEDASSLWGEHCDGTCYLLISEKVRDAPKPEYFREFGRSVNAFGNQCQSLQNISLTCIRFTDEKIHPLRSEAQIAYRFEILDFYRCEH